MAHSTLSIASLVGSRICHDLISPVGAINNGIELISMGGPIDTPELSLINESVNNASSRIKFFRIAFGAAAGEQMMGAAEVARIAREAFDSGRHSVDWQAAGDLPRPDVQAIFLAILCAESALPRGGEITVMRAGQGMKISATGPRLAFDTALWGPLAKGAAPEELRPAHVQFALLPLALEAIGRKIAITERPEQIEIAF